MSNLDYAAKQLNKIRNRILQAAQKAGRDSASIKLIGASKMQPVEMIDSFVEQGLVNLGENYLQEALEKQNQLSNRVINWHFIGHIQSKKCKQIAQHFSWVHGVDRLKVAQGLDRHSPSDGAIKVLVQLNLDGEVSKSGVSISEAAQLCDQISQLDNVSLEGFMVIPKPSESLDAQRESFARAKQCLDSTNQQHGLHMHHLSMGMSNDLEAAIAQGSTMIRVGSDLFGPRPAAQSA